MIRSALLVLTVLLVGTAHAEPVYQDIDMRQLVRLADAIVVAKKAKPFVVTDGRALEGKDGKTVVVSDARYNFVVTDVLTKKSKVPKLAGEKIVVFPADMELHFEALEKKAKEGKSPTYILQRYAPIGKDAFEDDSELILFLVPQAGKVKKAKPDWAFVVTSGFEAKKHLMIVGSAIENMQKGI